MSTLVGPARFELATSCTPSKGNNDIFSQSQGAYTAKTVTGLPTDGRALYVRLWSRNGTNWLFRDY